jgi:DNA-binding transcriptional ArsR family regulator
MRFAQFGMHRTADALHALRAVRGAKALRGAGLLLYTMGEMNPDSENCGPFLKALADKTRWHIVQALLSGPLTVGEVADRANATQYNVSKHVRVLREPGIIKAVKCGKHLQCQIAPSFQRRMAKNKKQLDLGCCVFRFDKNSP